MNIINTLFSIMIIYLIILLCRQGYNYVNYTKLPEEVENMIVEETDYIPKNIYMTYKNNKVSPTIFEDWKRLNPEYEIHFHDNEDAYKYILENYGQDFADYFNEIKYGPIKADFWRLCVLYNEGGIYADIDIVPHVPISEFIPNSITFCTLIASYNDGKITQAFIATTKGNPIIKDSLRKIYSKRNGSYPWWGIKYFKEYWGLSGTYDMYDVISKYLGTRNIKKGTYQADGQKILLFKETCEQDLIRLEQYNCRVQHDGQVLFSMRNSDYDKDKHEFK